MLDPLRGYLMLGAQLNRHPEAFSSAWNFGPAEMDALRVQDLVTMAGANWELDPAPRPPEAVQLSLDSGKAREHLGWVPRWSLQTAAARTVAWYEGFAQGESASALCRADMEAHLP